MRISTDDWAAGDRVERWREEFAKHVTRTEVLPAGEQPERFAIDLAITPGLTVAATRMHLRSVAKVRDGDWLRDGADDLTLMLCLNGGIQFDHQGTRAVIRPGQAALFCHQLPVALAWDRSTMLTLQLPRALLAAHGDPERVAGRVVDAGSPSLRLLRAYLAEATAAGLTALAERHLVELAADALFGASDMDATRREARSTARLAAAEKLITAAVANGESLSASDVGRTLGVSARTIERDFAISGSGFASAVTDARLNAVAAVLPRTARGISEAAFAAGFNDLSHFNRAFRERFGETPSDYRRRSQGTMMADWVTSGL